MPQTRSTKVQTPINSDTFNLTGDLATMAESIPALIPVANDAEGDTIATARAAAGFAVNDARPLTVYNNATKTIRVKDSGGWRDMNGPLGLIYENHVATSSSAVTDAIIFNINPFTFYSGRNYRIVWDTSFYQSNTTSLFHMSVNLCATGDASGLLTGLTNIGGRTKGAYVGASVTQSHGPITAYYSAGTGTATQIKFRAERVVGTATMVVVGQTNEKAAYLIYDDGAVI